MRVLYIFLLALVSPVFAAAQKVYFIYLQTDNNTPFYVKMDDRLISSASSGYLILSNLRDSTYQISIGFPSVAGESRFSIPLQGRDHGFLIKNFDYGRGLFDLQSLSVIRSKREETAAGISFTRRTDDFSTMLAKAAGDSSLLWQQVASVQDVAVKTKTEVITEPKVIIPEPKKEDSPPHNLEVRTDGNGQATPPGNKDKVNNAEAITDPVTTSLHQDSLASNNGAKETAVQVSALETAYHPSHVKKHSESSTSEGFGLVFYDMLDEGIDTIRLVIPNPRFVFIQEKKAEENTDMLQQADVKQAAAGDTVAAKKCASQATDQDFYRLRRDMAARMTDEEMTDEARKVFPGICFTTEQIRNLGALFLTPAGKYLFFSAAQGHLSDPEHFTTLQTEIRDDYYLKRFKALTGE